MREADGVRSVVETKAAVFSGAALKAEAAFGAGFKDHRFCLLCKVQEDMPTP